MNKIKDVIGALYKNKPLFTVIVIVTFLFIVGLLTEPQTTYRTTSRDDDIWRSTKDKLDQKFMDYNAQARAHSQTPGAPGSVPQWRNIAGSWQQYPIDHYGVSEEFGGQYSGTKRTTTWDNDLPGPQKQEELVRLKRDPEEISVKDALTPEDIRMHNQFEQEKAKRGETASPNCITSATVGDNPLAATAAMLHSVNQNNINLSGPEAHTFKLPDDYYGVANRAYQKVYGQPLPPGASHDTFILK